MPLDYVDDLTPARWIVDRLHPFSQDAGAIIPPGFESYARIFHPATRRVGLTEVPVTWREIADANLRVHHSEMQFGALVVRVGTPARPREGQPGLFDAWPKIGSLPPDLARALVEVLGLHTSTPEHCWFAMWEGWGDPVVAQHVGHGEPQPAEDLRQRPKSRPTLKVPQRGYYVAAGPLTAALEAIYGISWAQQSASIWWPDDRSWCVATEVDFDWTYVGGSAACIAEVLAHPRLEALPARLSDGVHWDSDPINPAPPR